MNPIERRLSYRYAVQMHNRAQYEEVENRDDKSIRVYRWEASCANSWKALPDDDHSLLDSTIAKILENVNSQRRLEGRQPNQLGELRHLLLILDCTESMATDDLKPTRFQCSLKLLQVFLDEFYKNNPLSQVGLIALCKANAAKITELTGDKSTNVDGLKTMATYELRGQPSLYNGLSIALRQFKAVPSHALREILIISSALVTVDNTPLDYIIDLLKEAQIRCSLITLSAATNIHLKLTQKTLGSFGAVLDEAHFLLQLLAFVEPPMDFNSKGKTLIEAGVPDVTNGDGMSDSSADSACCPQCSTKYCVLSAECTVCGFTLANATSVARSFHHVLPMVAFTKLPYCGQKATCHACEHIFSPKTDSHVYRCPVCSQIFCADCDELMHESTHLCVGCQIQPAVASLQRVPFFNSLASKESTVSENELVEEFERL